MSSVLEEVGKHPFITVRQLCRMFNASRSWTYGRLQKLQKKGLVDSVNARSPAIRARAFYYLTKAGAQRAGLQKRRGRPRFLERIEMVFELRNFFLSAQRAGIRFSDWQILTPAIGRVSLHGAAHTVDGQTVIVEWDRGNRPTRLYKNRLRQVIDRATEADCGLLVVAADEGRGAAMMGMVCGRLNYRGPLLAFSTRALIATQGLPDATCYVPAMGQSISIGGFVESLSGKPAVSVFEPGIMGYSGEWRGRAKTVLELSPTQKTLLATMGGVPLVTAKDLVALTKASSEEWVARELSALEQLGLVARYNDDKRFLIYHFYPTAEGVAFLAAQSGSPPKAYAKAKGLTLAEDGKVNVSYLTRVFEHTKETREMVLAFAQESARQRLPITWHDERESHVYFTAGGEPSILAPDARVRWGGKVIFVEVDRGTSSVGKIQAKLRTYYRFRVSAEYRRFGEDFNLMVIAPEGNREEMWLRESVIVANGLGIAPLPVITSTRDAVQKNGLSAPIWRSATSVTKRTNLERWI